MTEIESPLPSEIARALVKLRWAKTTKAERLKVGKFLAAERKRQHTRPGPPRTKPRCACGQMTRERAQKRGHKCGAEARAK